MIDTRTKVVLRNTLDHTKKVELDLPFEEEELKEALLSIGATTLDENGEEIDPFDLLVNEKPISSYEIDSFESDYLKDSDFQNLYAASDLVERIEDLDKNDEQVLKALLDDGEKLERALDEIEDGDIDFYPDTDLTELAQQFADEGLFSQDTLLEHIDYESLGRELSFDGYTEVSGGVLRRN